jgi:hypothetical protein
MNYILGYLSTGLLITMFFEYVFYTMQKDGDDTKFDSYLERLVSLLFWPFVMYTFMKEFFKKSK